MRKTIILLWPTLSAAVLLLLFTCTKGGAEAASGPQGLDPAKIDPKKPLTVKQLHEAYFVWKGKTVTLQGYCRFFFDRGKIGNKVELVVSPGSRERLVSCKMKQEYPEEFSRTEPVVIRARIKEDGYWGVELEEGVLVSRGKKVGTVRPFPHISGKSAVFSVADFVRAFRAWKGREVSVRGYYWGTTTSRTSYGKTVRIDLLYPQNRTLRVGCEMRGPHERIDRRSGVIIRGRVSGEVFGHVRLTNCILVNR